MVLSRQAADFVIKAYVIYTSAHILREAEIKLGHVASKLQGFPILQLSNIQIGIVALQAQILIAVLFRYSRLSGNRYFPLI